MDNSYDNQPDLYSEDSVESNEYTDNPPISWIEPAHSSVQRSTMWYIIFAFIIIGLILLDVLLLKYYTLSAVVLVSAVALIIYYRQPTKEINYTLSPDKGVYIDNVLHAYEDFKSFGVLNQGQFFTLVLIPTKRFGQSMTIHFPEQFGERIVDMVGQHLPMQEMKTDAIDRIIRRIGL